MVLMDQYETKFGIFNHELGADARPLALVALHPAEDTTTHSRLYERMVQYADLEVYSVFGVSWPEFISQPTDVCIYQLEVCAAKQRRKGQVVDKIHAEIEATKKAQGLA